MSKRPEGRQTGEARARDAGCLAELAAGGESRALRPGEVLYWQGDDPIEPMLYAVVRGLLLVERHGAGRPPHLLAVLGPGDLGGEVGALDPGPRSACITAYGPATVAVVPRGCLLDGVASQPDCLDALLRALSRRVDRTEGMLGDMTGLSITSRVSRQVVDLAERIGTTVPAGTAVEHRLTQEQLAGLAGSTRESVNKSLRVLRRAGWLTPGRGRVLVHDLEALRLEGARIVSATGGARRPQGPRAAPARPETDR